jgi:hypothetical protein
MFLKEKLLLVNVFKRKIVINVFFKKKKNSKYFCTTRSANMMKFFKYDFIMNYSYINYWIINKTCKIYLTFYYYQLFNNYIGGFDRSKY